MLIKNYIYNILVSTDSIKLNNNSFLINIQQARFIDEKYFGKSGSEWLDYDPNNRYIERDIFEIDGIQYFATNC